MRGSGSGIWGRGLFEIREGVSRKRKMKLLKILIFGPLSGSERNVLRNNGDKNHGSNEYSYIY